MDTGTSTSRRAHFNGLGTHASPARSTNKPSFHSSPANSPLQSHSDLECGYLGDRKKERDGHWVNRLIFARALDPHSHLVRFWNRVFFISCALSISVDPLFLFLASIDKSLLCLYIQRGFTIAVTVLRAVNDAVYLANMLLQFKLAYVSRESLVLGRGELERDPVKVARHYLQLRGGFLVDAFLLLPVPQVIVWFIVPAYIRSSLPISRATTLLLFALLAQYILKLVRIMSLARNVRRATGYIFGTAWWGFAVNLASYIIGSHVMGACWYLLATQRVESCLRAACLQNPTTCNLHYLGCPNPVGWWDQTPSTQEQLAWASKLTVSAQCLTTTGGFNYGLYISAIPLVTEHKAVEKVLYGLFWGLQSLSSFANALFPSNYIWEVVFGIIVIICGLLLFVLLIGNIQVFLQSLSNRSEEARARRRDLEWWMSRRQLPTSVKTQLRRQEQFRWAATRGVDEEGLVQDLPPGLRQDIKRHLCLNYVRKVPLFEHMDDLVLDNICERLKPLLLVDNVQVIREGEPVLRILFVIRGHLETIHSVGGRQTRVVVGPGSFLGEELLTWCMSKQPKADRLPMSANSVTSIDAVEAFVLEAEDLKFVTQNFATRLRTKKLEHTIRHYSPHWRTWAAVAIQLAWRRYKDKKRLKEGSYDEESPHAYALAPQLSGVSAVLTEAQRNKLLMRRTAAMFMSPKPQD